MKFALIEICIKPFAYTMTISLWSLESFIIELHHCHVNCGCEQEYI